MRFPAPRLSFYESAFIEKKARRMALYFKLR
ncbi:hypothetical protein CBM2587_B60146 [Cupriavidus taiwanensis]|uniref:Uncharacterized protein n=1 Tax=Cupriavidus taiwanensis TaxID=164546 RepID=A0A975X9L6_9BURK|nr:hypothetical protein CBM2587_B60146 [Cupriavidus taiwanensis]